MEPIRPDSDEVAARKNETRKAPPRPSAAPGKAAAGAATGGPGGGAGGHQDGSSRPARPSKLPLLLLVLLVLGGGWLLFQQNQAIDQLQGNLGEAEDWVNRSKLSMARFEGRMSEADRELLESGSQITEKLAFLDSEMRKLWGVANDRNRKAIAANQKAVDFLEKKTDYLDKQGAEQRQLLTSQTKRIDGAESAAQASKRELEKQLAALTTQQQSLTTQQQSLATQQQSLVTNIAANNKSGQSLEATQDMLQQQLNSFNQRQTLSVDELRARLDAMEKRIAAATDDSAVKNLQGRVSSLKNIVDSIDASRAQITGRLLNLEQRVQAANGG